MNESKKFQLPLDGRPSLMTSSNEQQEFNADLCEAMICANIPLKKLQNPIFKSFLEKYSKKSVPDESTLRKNYVPHIYNDTLKEVKKIVENRYIYFIVDETTDSCGRYIVNLLIGSMREDKPSESYLIACVQLDKINHLSILRSVNECFMNFFVPNVVPTEKILLMVSDAAPYMVKAGQQLKTIYPNLVHVTCLAHGCNRVAEHIRCEFSDVNVLISSVKKVFVKSPLRVQLYREKLPNVPLPPEPVLTRWGTWLEAAIFYAEHFVAIKELLLEFNAEDSAAIAKAQNIVTKTSLANQLTFIKMHYSFIVKTINNLEKQKMSLIESVEIVKEFKENISKVPGKIGNSVNKKCLSILEKNSGFKTLEEIYEILNGNFEIESGVEFSAVSHFKYAPITSVDVERSFSSYKNILSDKRQNFLVENLEKHIVVNYNRRFF